MARIESVYFDLARLDELSRQETQIHRLDPRAKVLTTLVFVAIVVSYEKYEISALLPFTLFPVILLTLGQLPTGIILKKVLLAVPFAICIGIFNPLFDREGLLQFGPILISGGWVSFISIFLRSVLTVSVALLLIATTSFSGVCLALDQLGLPRVFVVQLLFLQRYLMLLVDEGQRLVRARTLRSFQGRGLELRVFAQLIGQLLLRTLDRAQRIHAAMLSRGFNGEIPWHRQGGFGRREVLFTLGWSGFFILLRFSQPSQWLGSLLVGVGR